MVDITPIGERLIVVPDTIPMKIGLIIIPEGVKVRNERAHMGEVVSVSDKFVEGVEPGDRILYNRFAGRDIKRGDTDYVVLPEYEIMGVWKNGN